MSSTPGKRDRPYSRLMKYEHDKVLLHGASALLVYVGLCRLHSDARPDEKNEFPAGAAAIAKHCGLTSRCVKKYLPLLAKDGLIAIKSGRKIDGKHQNEENRFTLLGRELDSPPREQGSPRREPDSSGRESDASVTFPVYVVKKEKRKRKGVEASVAKIIPLPHGPPFADAWQEFSAHRSELGHSLTPTASNLILSELAAVSESSAVESIHQAVTKGWRKPFPKSPAHTAPLLGKSPRHLELL